MKKKILVTGGTGYIGSHTIIELYRNTDLDVISIDNYSRSYMNTLDRIKSITSKNVINYEIDLRNLSLVEKVFEENPNIDGVIHFAAFKSVPESVEKPLLYYDNNLNSLINILKCCKKYNVANFIFSSSCSIYGNVDQLPVNETTPVGQTESAYGHTKIIGEEIIRNFVNASDIKALPLRYFNPVGADLTGLNGENSVDAPNNLVPVITKTAIGEIEQFTVFGDDYNTRDGSCIRDYIHVSDIANAHILAIEYLINKRNHSNYEVFNLGTGNGVTVLEAIKSFEKVSGVKLSYKIGPRREGDVEAIFSDSSKAKKLLHWNCRYDLDDMMLSAWKWQQELIK